VQALLENLKREIDLNGTDFTGLLKWNYGDTAFDAPPFVPGMQEKMGVVVLDNHTVMHEDRFPDCSDGTSATHIWESDQDNSAAVVAELNAVNLKDGGINLTSGGSVGHQTCLSTAGTHFICTTEKPWWVKARFNIEDHDECEFFFGLTERQADVDDFHLTAAGAGTDRIGFVKAAHDNDAVTFAASKNAGGTISTAFDTAQTYDSDKAVVTYGIHWDGVDKIKFYANKVASGETPGDMELIHTYSTSAGIPDVNMRLVLMIAAGVGVAQVARIEYIKGCWTK
jgi:hypothetical protein